MIVECGKVRLRDRSPDDYNRESIWGLDREINRLDPIVGKVFNEVAFSIETLEGQHIGSCMLYNDDGTSIQLGIRIGDKSFWNTGYGTDAVRALVGHCFATTNVERIWLKVLPENIRAIRCYEKCEFEYSGELLLEGFNFITMERGRNR